MKILAVSDIIVDWIYSPKIRHLLTGFDLAIGCGDLPKYYLDFIVSSLDIPMFYVHGNHSLPDPEEKRNGYYSRGMVNLHRMVERYKGFTFAGVEGSVRYKEGDY